MTSSSAGERCESDRICKLCECSLCSLRPTAPSTPPLHRRRWTTDVCGTAHAASRRRSRTHSANLAGRSESTIADQTSPFERIVRRRWLAADAHHRPNGARDRLTVPPEQDHRRRAVAGDVGPAGVDDVGQVDRGKNSSISFLPNSRFMKLLAVICPVKPPSHGQSRDPLHERHRQRVLHVAGASTARGTPR